MARKVVARRAGADNKKSKKPTMTEVREKAATATSGLGGVLNVCGSLARAAGVMITHVAPGGKLTGKGLDAIGEQLQQAAQALGAASSLIGGSVVVAEQPEEGIVDAEVVDDKKVPPGRKPRKAG